MIKVQDIAYVRFSAPDLDAMQRFAADFGLVLTARENDVLYHRGTDPSCWCAITSASSTHSCSGVAYTARYDS